MPVYMDIHQVPPDATPSDVAAAHHHDVEIQDKYGVNYLKYWLNEKDGKVFCLCHAPDAESARRVHAEAHGLVAEKLIEVEPEMAELFLGSGEANTEGAVILPGGSRQERDPGIRTVFFTDIVGSTSLTNELGDDAGMQLIHLHDGAVRGALREFGGREIKHTGDGIMASFVSAAAAVRAAMNARNAISAQSRAQLARPIEVRVGLAAGEPVEHHHDLFGCTVQLAARLCAAAAPGQVLVSNVVAELCLGKGLRFAPLGEMELKGFEKPVSVHAAEPAA